jgi:carboxypeptidase C (cathepsin A)
MMRQLYSLLVATLGALVAVSGIPLAQTPERATTQAGIQPLLPPSQTTEHVIHIQGRPLQYEAQAGTIPLLASDGSVTADVFHVSYVVRPEKSAEPARQRPITFVFNGGPGAASAYLHLGALGPRIVETAADGSFLPPPQTLADNPDTWLDFTDLVFVDPVGTGYSREAPGQQARSFWSIDNDAASMGAFIRLYLAQHNRAQSPVYMAGESYGGFRAALLARTLQEDVGITPSGVILISPALEFLLIRPDEFDPLHFALELPTLAAVRLQRAGVAGPELRRKLAEVEEFALTDYLVALAKGPENGSRYLSGIVAEMTGLPRDLVERNFGRISTGEFAREFARPRGQVLSLYDGMIETGDLAPQSGGSDNPDPVLDRSVPVLTSAFTSYLRDELGYRTNMSYRLLNQEIARSWDYGIGGARQGYAGVMDDLQKARSLNPAMGVLIVNGYTDLVTPYMISRYLLSQMTTVRGARPIALEVFEGGHMMYLREDGRRALHRAVRALFQS